MPQDAPPRTNSKLAFPWAYALVIALLVGLVYLPALRSPWVFDSTHLISRPEYRELKPIWEAVTTNSRSLVLWTFALQRRISGPSPLAFHLFNISVHIVAAWTLMGVARRTLQLPRINETLRSHATALAFVIALLWALHPLQTQAVTYTIQRFESMMALMFLLTLYCFVRGTQSPRPAGWFVGTVIACFLGMTCKSIMVVAPLVVLLYDYTFVATSVKDLLRRRWWLHLSLFATAAWGVYLERGVFAAGNPGATAGVSFQAVTPWEYLRTQPEVLLHYLRLAFWPTTLCIDYAWPVQNSALRYVTGGLLIIALLAASLYGTWRRSPVGFLGLTIFLVLAPTSSFVPILDLAVEHRVYLPLAALVSLVVCLVFVLTEKLMQDDKARLALQIGAVGVAVVALGFRTVVRNVDYADPVRLWTKAAQVNPKNARPYSLLGDMARQRGDSDDAIQHYEKALTINDRFFYAHANLASLYLERGEIERAIKHCDTAIEIRPHRAVTYVTLGECYERQGDKKLAKKCYQFALKQEPYFAPAHNNLGMLLVAEGKPDEGIEHLQEAIKFDPGYVIATVNLAKVLFDKQQLPEARLLLQRAVGIEPRYAPGHLWLGKLEAEEGNHADAIESMRRAIQLAPEWPDAPAALAYFLATTSDSIFRDGPEALKLAEQSIKLEDAPSYTTLEALAAAQFSVGNLTAAIATIDRAIEAARKNGISDTSTTAARLQDLRRQMEQKSGNGKDANVAP